MDGRRTAARVGRRTAPVRAGWRRLAEWYGVTRSQPGKRASLDKQPHEVAAMFDGVASRYDLTNTITLLRPGPGLAPSHPGRARAAPR